VQGRLDAALAWCKRAEAIAPNNLAVKQQLAQYERQKASQDSNSRQ
jgi:hypothetical protein